MRKVADFDTFKTVKNMSFNDFNRWVTSVYTTAYQDGKDSVTVDDESLYRLLTSVHGVGDKTAGKIIDKWRERQGVQAENS